MKLNEWITAVATSERVRKILDQPTLFNFVRGFLAGSQNEVHQYIQQTLKLSPNDTVIDICCGTGDYAEIVPGDYTGVDLNSRFIQYAQNRYLNSPNKKFITDDATCLQLPDKSYHYAFFISSLHHFPEDLVLKMLLEIKRVTIRKVAVVDLVSDKRSPIRYLLTQLDRGNYVRPIEKQREIINSMLKIQQERVIVSRLAILAVYICEPEF
jgi:ubiquinone/menaquinone biosynthesis C-methylase UbiE